MTIVTLDVISTSVLKVPIGTLKPACTPRGLYSYGPRYTTGGTGKFPCGGGVGVDHSSVVACQGFSTARSFFRMLQKKLMMNGIWANARPQADQEEMTVRP